MKKLFFAGFTATTVMTLLMHLVPMMGMPKMDIAPMPGTMFVASPTAALWLGMLIHLMMGTAVFPTVYHFVLQPESSGETGRGLGLG